MPTAYQPFSDLHEAQSIYDERSGNESLFGQVDAAACERVTTSLMTVVTENVDGQRTR